MLGLISSALLAMCALVYLWEFRKGKHKWTAFTTVWYLGEITGLVYCAIASEYNLIPNYMINTICLTLCLTNQ